MNSLPIKKKKKTLIFLRRKLKDQLKKLMLILLPHKHIPIGSLAISVSELVTPTCIKT